MSYTYEVQLLLFLFNDDNRSIRLGGVQFSSYTVTHVQNTYRYVSKFKYMTLDKRYFEGVFLLPNFPQNYTLIRMKRTDPAKKILTWDGSRQVRP